MDADVDEASAAGSSAAVPAVPAVEVEGFQAASMVLEVKDLKRREVKSGLDVFVGFFVFLLKKKLKGVLR